MDSALALTPLLSFKDEGFDNPIAQEVLMVSHFINDKRVDKRVVCEFGFRGVLIYELVASIATTDLRGKAGAGDAREEHALMHRWNEVPAPVF